MSETGAGSDYLVVIGSSAGGIDALSRLVERLPATFPAPVIVAQHLDSDHPSRLATILAQKAAMEVVTVEDHADLRPARILVVPADRHVDVTDHELRLVNRVDRGRPAPSVDRLLSTAASVFGEQLVAVILTGTGHDGADGARDVKAAGGTVLIQDPETAAFPSMPLSLEPTVVDLVAKLDAMGPLLNDLVTGAYRPKDAEDEVLMVQFLADVHDRTGIDFSKYKRSTIERRLQRRLAATGSPRLRDYVAHLERQPAEYQRLVSSFLIKVTDFFRDAEMFERLRETIVPELIEAASRNRELRIWTAGCATGEEAYSIAILVADLLGPALNDWTVRIFATDLDPDAIEFARRGTYRAAVLRDLPADVVERHFVPVDGGFEVGKHLRAMTVFGQHDLARRAPFPRIDLAMCRNVLIYFTPELQRRALQLFAFSIRDGGYLALGKAETTTPLPEYFVPFDPRLRLFKRQGSRIGRPFDRVLRPPRADALEPIRQGDRLRGQLPLSAGAGSTARGRSPADAVLDALPTGVLMVDQSYRVRAVNDSARRLLGIRGAGVGEDLLHAIDGVPHRPLRVVVDGAIRGESIVLTATAAPEDGAGAGPPIELSGHPARGGDSRDAVLTVRQIDASTEGADMSGEPAMVDDAQTARRLREQVDANRRLRRDNENLVRANGDLRVANEELLVAGEEAQAATEEVETLYEELQATNEELETLNEELQATVEELNTTNEDLRIRTVELEQEATLRDEQRRVTEMERLRLAILIGSLSDAVAVIDGEGRVVIENEAFASFVADEVVSEDDAGRPVSPGDLRARVAAGQAFALQFAARTPDGRRRWFEAYGRPVPAEMGVDRGGILVIHDTTDVGLRRMQEEFVGIVAHELRTPLTALRGYLQLLSRRGGKDGADARLVASSARQADRLAGLVDELFEVTRADTGRLVIDPQPTALQVVVNEAVEIAQSLADDQPIVLEGELDEAMLDIDTARIQQVLLNVLTNAQRHAPSSPTVTVRLRRLRAWVAIEVEDHGPGIPPSVMEGLFSRFHRDPETQGGGLGLGLYISREIVTAHGGTIEADSVLGEGTTITIRLPIARGSAAAAQREPRGSKRKRSPDP